MVIPGRVVAFNNQCFFFVFSPKSFSKAPENGLREGAFLLYDVLKRRGLAFLGAWRNMILSGVASFFEKFG